MVVLCIWLAAGGEVPLAASSLCPFSCHDRCSLSDVN